MAVPADADRDPSLSFYRALYMMMSFEKLTSCLIDRAFNRSFASRPCFCRGSVVVENVEASGDSLFTPRSGDIPPATTTVYARCGTESIEFTTACHPDLPAMETFITGTLFFTAELEPKSGVATVVSWYVPVPQVASQIEHPLSLPLSNLNLAVYH